MKGFGKCVAVRICPRICFCGESISKNAFRRFESVYRPKMHEMHLQNFEKLQSQKKRRKNVGSRIFARGEDSRALRLASELADLLAANADLHSVPRAAQNRANRTATPANTKATQSGGFCVVTCVRFRCKTVCG